MSKRRENRFFLEKDGTTGIVSIYSAIKLGSLFWFILQYVIELVQVETTINTAVPASHSRVCANMH